MKNLSSFEAFKLNKVQMGVVKGGTLYHCMVEYGFGDFYVRVVESEQTLKVVEAAVAAQAPDASVNCM